jgi:hypothetical protein
LSQASARSEPQMIDPTRHYCANRTGCGYPPALRTVTPCGGFTYRSATGAMIGFCDCWTSATPPCLRRSEAWPPSRSFHVPEPVIRAGISHTRVLSRSLRRLYRTAAWSLSAAFPATLSR